MLNSKNQSSIAVHLCSTNSIIISYDSARILLLLSYQWWVCMVTELSTRAARQHQVFQHRCRNSAVHKSRLLEYQLAEHRVVHTALWNTQRVHRGKSVIRLCYYKLSPGKHHWGVHDWLGVDVSSAWPLVTESCRSVFEFEQRRWRYMIFLLVSHFNNFNTLLTTLCSHNQVFYVIAYNIVISSIQSTYVVIQIYLVFKPIQEQLKHLLL